MSAAFLSIVIPCRNEGAYIGPCLESVIQNGFPHERMEVLVADGRSEDRTRAVVEDYARRYPFIRLVDNAKRHTPGGLNAAIGEARGGVIMRLDAHACYAPGYIAKCVAALNETDADNVGGLCLSRPSADTPMARAIALGMSHPFGVGNSYFRIGASVPRFVDTVPFGCFRRSVFERIGFFDEELPRNQDDEFNARMLRHGMKILLVPEITSDYYVRDTLPKLWRMFYQYGYYKPLAAWKVGKVVTLRQLVPAALVTALGAGAVLSLFWPAASAFVVGLAALYGAAAMVLSAREIRRRRETFACWAGLCLVFPCLHFSYGIGYLFGLGLLARRFIRKTGAGPVQSAKEEVLRHG